MLKRLGVLEALRAVELVGSGGAADEEEVVMVLRRTRLRFPGLW